MDKNKRFDKMLRLKDNRGFSLMELLVSIVILILIMVPLMNNFFRSVKINNEAEKLQNYSNMAADYVEDIKANDLTATLTTYDYTNNGLVLNGDHSYSKLITPVDPQADSYLGLVKSVNGIQYDVLLKISSKAYQFNSADHGGILMNSYNMPDITAVDEKVNGMFFANMYMDQIANTLSSKDDPLNSNDKQLDIIAQKYFEAAAAANADKQLQNSSEYKTYLEALDEWPTKYQEAKLSGDPLPERPVEPHWSQDDANYSYCKSDNIINWITKTADIQLKSITDAEGKTKSVITYQITYTCDWTKSSVTGLDIDNFASWTIESQTYGSLVKKVYLYYQSSLFQKLNRPDAIRIKNDNGVPLDLFIVKQNNDLTDPSVIVYRNGAETVNIYTNLNDDKVNISDDDGSGDQVNNQIITSSQKNRIYSVVVRIYRYVEGAPEEKYKEQDLLYTLDSNKDQ